MLLFTWIAIGIKVSKAKTNWFQLRATAIHVKKMTTSSLPPVTTGPEDLFFSRGKGLGFQIFNHIVLFSVTFEKAFHSTEWNLLWSKLRNYGLGEESEVLVNIYESAGMAIMSDF